MPEIRNPEMFEKALLRALSKEKENVVSHFATVKGAEIRSPLPACTPLTDITEYLQILQMTRARQPNPKARVRSKIRQPMLHFTPSQEIPAALQETETDPVLLQRETETDPVLLQQETESETAMAEIPALQQTEANPIQPEITMTMKSPEEQGRLGSLCNLPQTKKKKSSLKPLMKMR